MTHRWREVRDFLLLLVRILWHLGVSLAVLGLALAALWALQRAYAYHFGFDQTHH